MLMLRALGSSPAAVRALADAFARFVDGTGIADAVLGELVVFEGVRAVKSRRECARLPFAAAIRALTPDASS
jgi:hypothetical protein